MSARFRIRTKEGQELSFASHEVFAEFVRSGELSPDDVVYDAETREWSSALTHPVVLQIEAGHADGASGETDQPPHGDAPQRAIDLDLAPAPMGLTPEQEAAAFVAKMEAERAAERSFDDELPGFKMERGSSNVLGGLPPTTAEPEPAPPPAPKKRSRSERSKAPKRPERRKPPRTPAPAAVPPPPKRKRSRRAAGKHAPFAILGVAAVAASVYFAPRLIGPASSGEEDPQTSVEPPSPPEIAATEEAVRARARERFLAATQAALRDLQPIPDVWLHGSYLAAPSDYPRVREIWESYLTTVREVRARDSERYREAYLRALDDARVAEGGTRTLRLSGAAAAFQENAEGRTAHYARVEALALAALRGHDALVEAEGTIMYQPATGPALSGDPVIEAVGRSPAAQTLLNQVLDGILSELHADDGPGETRTVREWVWGGFLDAVTG